MVGLYTEEKKLLIAEYGEICFLGGTVSEKNVLSCHHIFPVSENGKEHSLKNMALIARLEHDIIHKLEQFEPETIKKIRDYLRRFKDHPDMLARADMHEFLLTTIEDYGFVVVENAKTIFLQNTHESKDLGRAYYLKKCKKRDVK